jgi:hypothetical protein
MAKPQLANPETKVKSEDHASLKGTLASVFFLGFFLIFTWIGVYYLFIDRL